MVPFRFAFSLFVALSALSGCQYGNGSPCQVDSDCASNVCCGESPSVRGVCQPEGAACVVVDSGVREDAGMPEDTGMPDAGFDSGIDTGIDAPEDTGVGDTGIDAPSDAGSDAPSDAGNDTGVDAP